MAKDKKSGSKCKQCGANEHNKAHKLCDQRLRTGDCIVHHQYHG